jgi:hypothetical protein
MTDITEKSTVLPVSDEELRGRLEHLDTMLHDVLFLLTPISRIVNELAPMARRYQAMAARTGTVAAHLRGRKAGRDE